MIINPIAKVIISNLVKYGSLFLATKYGMDATTTGDVVSSVATALGLGTAVAVSSVQNKPDTSRPSQFVLGSQSTRALNMYGMSQYVDQIAEALSGSSFDFGFRANNDGCYVIVTDGSSATIGDIIDVLSSVPIKLTVFDESCYVSAYASTGSNPFVEGNL